MQVDAMVWNTTRTGFKVHAFKGGSAVCRTNIKEGMAPVHTKETARRWVISTPGLSFCEDCEYRFDFLVQMDVWHADNYEAGHAEALEMNAQYDSQSASAAVITDAELDRRVAGGSIGYRKAARELRPLSPEDRFAVVQEANCRMALSPGWNFSGAVSQAVNDLGTTPMTDQADQIKAYDPDGTKAAEAAARGTSWDAFKEAAQYDAKDTEQVCICPVRTDYHTADCQLFQAAHTDAKENRMTIKDGPLTARQVQVIEHVSQGMRHKEIARQTGVSLQVVRQEVTNVTQKMGASTSYQAVALYARAQAFMDAATFVGAEGADKAVHELTALLDTRGRNALPK